LGTSCHAPMQTGRAGDETGGFTRASRASTRITEKEAPHVGFPMPSKNRQGPAYGARVGSEEKKKKVPRLGTEGDS